MKKLLIRNGMVKYKLGYTIFVFVAIGIVQDTARVESREGIKIYL